MIEYLKSNVKLDIPYHPLKIDITKEEIDSLLTYIKRPAIQHLLTPDSTRSEEFTGSKYIRLVNGCINPGENNNVNWNKFFDWMDVAPTPERRDFYHHVRDLTVPLAIKMMQSLANYTNQKHYTHGVEINTVLPNAMIKGHADSHFLVAETHRVHLVLETNDDSYMICNNEKSHFPMGSCFIFNNLMRHSVHNEGAVPRTHLVIDFLTLV